MNTPVIVQGTWNRNGTELVDGTDSGRIAVVNPAMSTPPYVTTVRFNLLNNDSDVGTYECVATVNPQNTTYISGATSAISRIIAIFGIHRLQRSAMLSIVFATVPLFSYRLPHTTG